MPYGLRLSLDMLVSPWIEEGPEGPYVGGGYSEVTPASSTAIQPSFSTVAAE